jgi:hypothetical protein
VFKKVLLKAAKSKGKGAQQKRFVLLITLLKAIVAWAWSGFSWLVMSTKERDLANKVIRSVVDLN